MNITISYFAQIRQAAGMESEPVEVPGGATVLDAVRSVDHGAQFKALLFNESGALHPVILFLVNDIPAAPDRPLKDGDRISIFSPVAGG